MTEYSKMKAFLTALELDQVAIEVRKAIATAKRTGDFDSALPALKKRDDLTTEYWRALGVKE